MFIGGIASGLDTEALINQLLAIERRPMVQMQEQKALLGQQRDAWRDINTRLNHLRERMAELRSPGLYHARTASSTDAKIVSAAAKPSAAEGAYAVEVVQLAQAHRVSSAKFDNVDDALGIAGDLIINGVTVQVEDNDSLKAIAAKINGAEDVGVRAVVIDGQLVLRATATGTAHEIQFGGGLAGPRGEGETPVGLGFAIWDNDQWQAAHVLSEALDAHFFVEGIEITRGSNVIDDVIEGVAFTLHDVGAAEVKVQKDFDGIVNAVQALVDQYNSVQTFISSAQASNPEQRRTGLLAGDGLAMRIQSQLRTGLMGAVAGSDEKYNSLMSVGVSVDRYGKMTLDASKLRAALDEDPGAVQRLFGGQKDGDGFDGVAVRLEATFQSWLATNTGLLAERQKMFGERIKSLDQSMDRMEQRLEMRERTLMRQFAALEDVLARFQTQAMWLEGQIQQMNAMAGAVSRRR